MLKRFSKPRARETTIKLSIVAIRVDLEVYNFYSGELRNYLARCVYLGMRCFGKIQKRICDLRSFGSWCIKGTDESTLDKDSSVPLMHQDPNDLRSQIRFCILPKKLSLSFRNFIPENFCFWSIRKRKLHSVLQMIMRTRPATCAKKSRSFSSAAKTCTTLSGTLL